MPDINNGRVSTDGQGSVSFDAKASATNNVTATLGVSTGQGLGLGIGLGLGGIQSVRGTNLGSGVGVYTGSDGSSNVTLEFKSILAGPGFKITQDQNTITLSLDSSTQRFSFLQITEAPSRIVPAAILFGNSQGTLSFTQTATQVGSTLVFNGIGFDWKVPQQALSTVNVLGDNAIAVTPTTTANSASFGLTLKPTGVAPGTYTAATLTVDAQGRITGAVSTPVGETNTGANLDSGAQVYAGKVGTALQFKTIKASGLVAINETANTITLSANAVTAVSLVAGPGINVSGTTVTQSGGFTVGLANSGVAPGTYNQITVDSFGRVTSGTFVAQQPSNPTQNATVSIQNIGQGTGIYANQTANTVNLKTLVPGGIITITPTSNSVILAANAVTSVGLDAGTGITVTGNTITQTGRYAVALSNTAVQPGTYSLAQVTVDQQGRIVAAANGSVAPATGNNLGSTFPVYVGTSNSALQFRTLTAGANVQIAQTDTDLTIHAMLPQQAGLTVSNGTTSVANATSLTFGAGLTLVANGNAVTVTAPSQGGSSLTLTDRTGNAVTTSNLALGAGLLLTNGALSAPAVAMHDANGNVATDYSVVSLVGLTLTTANGVATITANTPAQVVQTITANAAVTDGTNVVMNPFAVRFSGATVSSVQQGQGNIAVITIPQGNGGTVTQTIGLGVGSTANTTVADSTYTANVSQINFSGFNVSALQQGGILVQAPNAAGLTVNGQTSVQALTFSGATVTTDANGTTVAFAQQGSSANAVLLTGDQTIQGQKTFANALVAGGNFTVVGKTTLTDSLVAQNSLKVTNGITADAITLTSGPTITSTLFTPIQILTAIGQTASSTLQFNQLDNVWEIPGASFRGNLQGTAALASAANALATPVTLMVQGDVTGSTLTPFDGTQNTVTIQTTLSNTGVAAGQYTNPTLTVDATGRVTLIANGAALSGGGQIVNSGTGTPLSTVSNGTVYLTSLSTNTANGVLLVPTNGTLTVDVDKSKFGSVTSVNVVGQNGISVTGSAVTTSGAFMVGLSNTTVIPGSYTNATINVDQYGRITMAQSGDGSSSSNDTAANIGTGDAHVFAQKTAGGEFQFRSLVAGDNVTLVETGTTITISANASTSAGLSAVAVSDGTHTANASTLTFVGAAVSGDGDATTITVPTGTVQSINARSSDGSVNVTGGPVISTGTFDITLANTGVAAGTYNYATITVDSYGRVTAASQNAAPSGTAGGTVTSVAVASPSGDLVVTGSPITTSGTINLALSANVLKTDANGNFTANTITASLNGNALTATSAGKLTTARAITLTQDVTGTATFDGTANAVITASLANTGVTPGTYNSVTVDAKGRVTAATTTAGPVLRNSDVVTVQIPSTTSYSFTYNGGTPLTINPNFLFVYLGRMRLRPSEYSVSGNVITFSISLNTGDELEVATTA